MRYPIKNKICCEISYENKICYEISYNVNENTLNIIVLVVENGISDLSSNLGQGCLSLTLY